MARLPVKMRIQITRQIRTWIVRRHLRVKPSITISCAPYLNDALIYRRQHAPSVEKMGTSCESCAVVLKQSDTSGAEDKVETYSPVKYSCALFGVTMVHCWLKKRSGLNVTSVLIVSQMLSSKIVKMCFQISAPPVGESGRRRQQLPTARTADVPVRQTKYMYGGEWVAMSPKWTSSIESWPRFMLSRTPITIGRTWIAIWISAWLLGAQASCMPIKMSEPYYDALRMYLPAQRLVTTTSELD